MVEQVLHDLEKAFKCKCEVELTTYVSTILTVTHDTDGFGTVKFKQSEWWHKPVEEYKPAQGPWSNTLAVAGQVLLCSKGPNKNVP